MFVADTVLAKHDETYMPPEVAKALKEKGVKLGEGPHRAAHAAAPESGRLQHRMIVELGHFALVLALLVAVCADGRAGVGRARARRAA